MLLHDRAIPGTRRNIDHIAVGPGGVTVIDPKAVKGKVRVERRGGLLSKRTSHLVVGGRDRTKLVVGVEEQVDVVRRAVGPGVDVRGALCWMEVDGLPLLGHLSLRDVAVDGTKRVAAIASRPGDWDDATIEAVARALAAGFPSR